MATDLEYLDSIVWRKFPRNADQTLRVSDATKEKVLAYLKANAFSQRELGVDVFATLNERLSFDEFRSMKQINSGLSKNQSNLIHASMCEFVRRGFIERIGDERHYQYRLKRLLVRQRKPRRGYA